MLLGGMSLGFSPEEAGSMSLTRLGMFIEAHNDLMADDGDAPKQATQGDIDALLA